MKRLLCSAFGHRWKYLAKWISKNREGMRECLRCGIIEQKVSETGVGGIPGRRRETWVQIGRRPEIVRVTKRRER